MRRSAAALCSTSTRVGWFGSAGARECHLIGNLATRRMRLRPARLPPLHVLETTLHRTRRMWHLSSPARTGRSLLALYVLRLPMGWWSWWSHTVASQQQQQQRSSADRPHALWIMLPHTRYNARVMQETSTVPCIIDPPWGWGSGWWTTARCSACCAAARREL